MVKRNGAGGPRGSNDAPVLRNRIEGFGNAPMPPPVPDSFEDRLHNALSQDETFGDWYNSARAGIDGMVTAFDDTVNAIADSIEDTVAAVVGDDDDVQDPPNESKGANKTGAKGERRKADKDDGERSGVKWEDIVEKICDEGDLDNFVVQVQNQCANSAEEREVAGLLSKQLQKAEKSSQTLRVLYVMQAVEEGDLPVVIDAIRNQCQEKLEKLKESKIGSALATQVLGDGPAPKTEEQKKEEEKAQKKKDKKENKAQPAAAAAVPDAAKAARQRDAANAASKPVDLLDVEAAPAKTDKKAAAIDLMDCSLAVAAPTPVRALDLMDMATPASAKPPTDLLSLDMTPMLAVTPPAAPAAATSQASSGLNGLNAFPSAPQNNAGQWAAFQSGGGMGQPSQSSFTSQPFGASSAMGSMSGMGQQPFGASPAMGSMSGYNQAFGSAPRIQPADSFNPNPQSSVPAMKLIDTSHSRPSQDPFSTLAPFASTSPTQPQGPKKVVTGQTRLQRDAASAAPKNDGLGLDDILDSTFAQMKVS